MVGGGGADNSSQLPGLRAAFSALLRAQQAADGNSGHLTVHLKLAASPASNHQVSEGLHEQAASALIRSSWVGRKDDCKRDVRFISQVIRRD